MQFSSYGFMDPGRDHLMEADLCCHSVQCQLSYEVPTHSIQDRLNQEQASNCNCNDSVWNGSNMDQVLNFLDHVLEKIRLEVSYRGSYLACMHTAVYSGHH